MKNNIDMKHLKTFEYYMDPLGKWEMSEHPKVGTFVNMEDLSGIHMISGVDYDDDNNDDASSILFILDGITYKAKEDPSDGYRSYMGYIQIVDTPVRYRFEPIEVDIIYTNKEEYVGLFFIDVISKKKILELATDYSDDYYPSCVMSWLPENIYFNIEADKFNF
jgi:hypothetical protein